MAQDTIQIRTAHCGMRKSNIAGTFCTHRVQCDGAQHSFLGVDGVPVGHVAGVVRSADALGDKNFPCVCPARTRLLKSCEKPMLSMVHLLSRVSGPSASFAPHLYSLPY